MTDNLFSHWNHRVIKTTHKLPDGSVEVEYGIHEVYYDSNGKPTTYTIGQVGVAGSTLDEVRIVLEQMKACVEKPILDADKNFS